MAASVRQISGVPVPGSRMWGHHRQLSPTRLFADYHVNLRPVVIILVQVDCGHARRVRRARAVAHPKPWVRLDLRGGAGAAHRVKEDDHRLSPDTAHPSHRGRPATFRAARLVHVGALPRVRHQYPRHEVLQVRRPLVGSLHRIDCIDDRLLRLMAKRNRGAEYEVKARALERARNKRGIKAPIEAVRQSGAPCILRLRWPGTGLEAAGRRRASAQPRGRTARRRTTRRPRTVRHTCDDPCPSESERGVHATVVVV